MMIMMLSSRIPRGEGRGRDGDKQVGEGEQGDATTKGSNLGWPDRSQIPTALQGAGPTSSGTVGVGGPALP